MGKNSKISEVAACKTTITMDLRMENQTQPSKIKTRIIRTANPGAEPEEARAGVVEWAGGTVPVVARDEEVEAKVADGNRLDSLLPSIHTLFVPTLPGASRGYCCLAEVPELHGGQ
jgi:hypothetical protein